MKQPIPKYILFLSGLLIFLNLFDAGATTFLVLANLGYEANPFMAWLIDLGIGWFLLFKIGFITPAGIFFAKAHTYKLARIALWVTVIPYFVIFVYYVVGFAWIFLV